MKKSIILMAVAFIAVAAVVMSFLGASPAVNAVVEPEVENNQVITVSDGANLKADTSKVLEARFLNMLNHNFVYNESFNTVEEIVNCSMPALLSYRDSEDEAFIAEAYVSGFVFDMYGIDVEDFSSINSDFEKKDGYVYILPRGFAKYEHKITEIVANEDGSYTVFSRVRESAHDGEGIVETCETLFVPCEESSFGFSIIYSNIGCETVSA